MKINEDIRSSEVRVIGADGAQVGVVSIKEALELAKLAKLDLVEVVPNATPPVCKIVDYGKFRYNQTKKEKNSKKSQHQVKVKEIKLKPNIDEHDLQTKVKHARQFIEKGNKVKVTCMFRGREMAHRDIGTKVVEKFLEGIEDLGGPESPLKWMGRFLTVVIAPTLHAKKTKS